ncbi:MAG: ferredoxin [Acidobacteria bacterium]|nr:ferredoxin [Acidobacteriota bacterium]
MPVVDDARCTGCRLCVDACGPACLEMVAGLAVLVRPDACGSEEHCIDPCRDDAIHMRWVPSTGDRRVGRWTPA